MAIDLSRFELAMEKYLADEREYFIRMITRAAAAPSEVVALVDELSAHAESVPDIVRKTYRGESEQRFGSVETIIEQLQNDCVSASLNVIAHGAAQESNLESCVSLLEMFKQRVKDRALNDAVRDALDKCSEDLASFHRRQMLDQFRSLCLCWVCKKSISIPGCSAKVEMKRAADSPESGPAIEWQTTSVEVPRCAACKARNEQDIAFLKARRNELEEQMRLIKRSSPSKDSWRIAVREHAEVMEEVLRELSYVETKLAEFTFREYPAVEDLRAKGWDFAEEPKYQRPLVLGMSLPNPDTWIDELWDKL